jgi:hypothetical protein
MMVKMVWIWLMLFWFLLLLLLVVVIAVAVTHAPALVRETYLLDRYPSP